MFKSFQNTSRTNGFNGFPALNFQMNNEAYGFSGCTFWLDASYGTNTQTDLAAVSLWQPKISPYQFIQATAGNQPRYIKNDPNFNNLSTVEFYSSGRNLTSQSSFLVSFGKTIIVVAKADSIQASNCVFRDSSNGWGVYYGGTAAGYEGPTWRGASLSASASDSTSSQISVFTSERIYVNGSQTNSGPLSNFLQTSFNTLGSNDISTLYGRIAEIVGFNFTMTTSQIETLSAGLNSKYAIY